MFDANLKLISLILFVGYLCGVQTKECYSCQGINCLRSSKVNNKAACIDPVDNCVTVFEECTFSLIPKIAYVQVHKFKMKLILITFQQLLLPEAVIQRCPKSSAINVTIYLIPSVINVIRVCVMIEEQYLAFNVTPRM